MAAVPKNFDAGQFLFREGDTPTALYIIKAGTVTIKKRNGPNQIEIAKIYSNEVLGELSFFDRQPRSASAIALTRVETHEIQFDALDKIYAGVPEYLRTIVTSVVDRLRKANDLVRRLQKGNGEPEKTEKAQAGKDGPVAPVQNTVPQGSAPSPNPAETSKTAETSKPAKDPKTE